MQLVQLWHWVVLLVVLAVATPGILHFMLSRRPRAGLDFNMIDEAIHHLDTEDEPWTVHVEARVAGVIDERRLKSAISKAIARHPMARAFQKKWRPWHTVYQWEIAERVSGQALIVESRAGAEGVAEARARFESTRVPIDAPPPFRVLLVHDPGGDYVMLNVNHAACDGVGTLRLFRSIARAYADEPDRELEHEDLAVRDLVKGTAPSSFRERWDRLSLLREALFGAVLSPPSRLAEDGGSVRPTAFGFELRTIAPEIVNRIAKLKIAGGTVNDFLLAALHVAIQRWNELHAAATDRVGTMMPVNVRPADRWFDVVGNITYFVSISTAAVDRQSLERAAAAVALQTTRIKERGTAAALREILFASPVLLLDVKRRLPGLLPLGGNRFVDTAVLSNLGRVSDSIRFGDSGPTKELWFTPPCRMPLGLGVGTATYEGRLFVAFRYRTALWDASAAGRFADLFERIVVDAVSDSGRATIGASQ